MSYSEPIVVFIRDAAEGKKLALERNWLFCGGGSTADVAAITGEAFRKGVKNGLVLTYTWAGRGIKWHRPNTQLVLINRPKDPAYEAQAVNSVRPISISRLSSVAELGAHKCLCPIQTLNLQGCQCGGE